MILVLTTINMFLQLLIFSSFIFTTPIHGITVIQADPPNPNQGALMSRYILHNIGWVAVSSISVTPEIESYPYNTVLEVCDGTNEKGNGVPYLYVTVFDPFHNNTAANDKCTLVASLAITEFCNEKGYEPEDPRCGRLMLSGRFVPVPNNTQEYESAYQNMIVKHPQIKYWPKTHNWYVAKIDVEFITLFDSFGGLKTINVDEYFNAMETDEQFNSL